MTLSLVDDQTLFGGVLDDLRTFRAVQMSGRTHGCGACGGEFTDPGEVFSHACPGTLRPAHAQEQVQVAEPQHHNGGGQPRPRAEAPARTEPIDPAKVEEWLLGLGRKVTDSDVTPRVNQAAREWVLRENLEGRIRTEWMGQMWERAHKGRPLSAGQARGLLNMWRHELTQAPEALGAVQTPNEPAPKPVKVNRFGGRCPNCARWVDEGEGVLENVAGKWVVYHREGECPVSEFTATDGTLVPEGRYAYDTEEGIKFFQLRDGRVLVQASDDLHPVPGGGQPIVDRIATDIEGAARLYGREIGACCRCGRTLTSEWRQQGIGPKCAQKAGW